MRAGSEFLRSYGLEKSPVHMGQGGEGVYFSNVINSCILLPSLKSLSSCP